MPHPQPRLRLLPTPTAFDYVEEALAEQHRVNGQLAGELRGIREELHAMNGKLGELDGLKKRWDRVFQAILIAAALAAVGAVAKSWARGEEARAQPPMIERQTR
jgi:hypothetical protein